MRQRGPLDGTPLLESGQRWREHGGGERRCRRGGGPRRRPRRGRGRSRGGGAHVVIGDAAARPARRHRAKIDAQLARQLSGGGGRRNGPAAGRRGSRRDGRGSRDGWWSCDGRWRCGGWRRPGGPRVRGGGRGPTRCIGEGHEHRPDLHRLPGFDVDLVDTPPHRGGDLHLSLVRLHLQQGRVFLDHVAFADEDSDDLRLGQPFAQVGQDELAGH